MTNDWSYMAPAFDASVQIDNLAHAVKALREAAMPYKYSMRGGLEDEEAGKLVRAITKLREDNFPIEPKPDHQCMPKLEESFGVFEAGSIRKCYKCGADIVIHYVWKKRDNAGV